MARWAQVVAAKRVPKKQTVILTRTVTGLGKEGQLVKVSVGYWRNFLQPQRIAEVATQEVRGAPRRAAAARPRLP